MFSRPCQPSLLPSDDAARADLAGAARLAAIVIVATATFVLGGCGGDSDAPARAAASTARTPGIESTAQALAANGTACATAGDCTSNFCVDGVCCDTACGGDGADCQACSIATGGAVDGTCGPRTVGVACLAGVSACTLTATCAAGGVCTPVTMKVCTAMDQCHDAGTCDPGTGLCNNPVKLNGTTCTDNNACTTGDSCQAGVCTVAATITCTAPDQCHDATTCNTTTGACVYPVKADGTSCNDGDLCTGTDTCVAGVCTGTPPQACTAIDQCHMPGTCNPATGICSNPIKPDGTSCNDGSMCTTGDACTGGACGGMQRSCNDGNACTQDTCVGSVGCVNTMIPMCPMSTTDAGTQDAAGDAIASQPDASAADTAGTDGPVDAKVDVVADAARADAAVADAAKVDAAGDGATADASGSTPDATATLDVATPGIDARKDASGPVAVGGGGGCDCNLNRGANRNAATPAQGLLLLGVGLLWFARRRRR
jgi:hypothetical protein